MGFIKMILPTVTLYAHPSGAIAAGKICDVGTASKTEFAVVANPLALRAIFFTVGANYGTFLARAAPLADQNTLRAQIAAFAEPIGTFAASFTAALAKDGLITALLTARAVIAVRNGTFDAQLIRGANIGAGCANAAIHTVFAAVITVRTLGAVHSRLNGTFLTDDFTCFFTAVQAGGGTIRTFAAFLTPASHLEIALRTFGTMSSPTGGALPAKNLPKIDRTALVIVSAIHTQLAFLAPQSRFKITAATAGAMAVFVGGTVHAK